MNSPEYRVRRAIIDDLPTLKSLWEALRLPADELEKRLTEFQVVESANGVLIGAVGFQINTRHGCIHSEVFSDFSLADATRPLLWERLQALATNHGVVRLWTRENTPFWTRNGLQPAHKETLERLPLTWDRSATNWLTLQLKDEEAIASLDKEFAMFVESEKRRSAAAMDQAKSLKTVFTVIGLGFALLLAGAAAYLVLTRNSGGLPGH